MARFNRCEGKRAAVAVPASSCGAAASVEEEKNGAGVWGRMLAGAVRYG